MTPVFDVCWIGVLLYIIVANVFLYGYFRQFIDKRSTPAYTQIVNEVFSFYIIAGLIYIFIFRGLISSLISIMGWGNLSYAFHNPYTEVIDLGAIVFITILCVWTARRISKRYGKEIGT